jgi:hypothetical protein
MRAAAESRQRAGEAATSDQIARENAEAAEENSKLIMGGLLAVGILLTAILAVLFKLCMKKTTSPLDTGLLSDEPAARESLDNQPNDSLSLVLKDAMLSEYEGALRKLGCSLPTDLGFVQDREMEQLGMKVIEIRRLKALAQSNGSAAVAEVESGTSNCNSSGTGNCIGFE